MADSNIALLSLGATATAIRTDDPGYPASRGIDNDHSTQWWAGSAPTTGCWYIIDLGAPAQVNSHRYNVTGNPAAYCANTYKIESSNTNNGSDWVTRYTSPGLAGASNPSDFTTNPTHVIPLTTPANARYWRFFCLTGAGSDAGGWSVYDFELWGAAPVPSQTLTLPKLTDAATLRAVTLVQGPARLTLPKLTDAAVLRAVVLSPDLALILPQIVAASVLRAVALVQTSSGLVLPKITNPSTLRAVTLSPDLALVLPKLNDAPTIRPVLLNFPANTLLLPKLTDASSLRAVVVQLIARLTLPHLDDGAAAVLFPPTLVGGPTTLVLPHLDDAGATVWHILTVDGGNIAIVVDVLARYWGEDSLEEGPQRYYVGQSVEVVGIFKDVSGAPVDPDTATVQVLSPSLVQQSYDYGTEPAFIRLARGIYRMRVVADEGGDWSYRWTGTSAGGSALPTTEGIFRVHITHFIVS
jgi:hypothetical protein